MAQKAAAKRAAPAKRTTRKVSERVRDAESMDVNVPVVGHVRVPRPEHLAFYGGLAALAALQLVEWPLALVLAVGHALTENHHHRVAQELGAALDEA